MNGCSKKLCPMQVGTTDNCTLTKEQCPYYTQREDYQNGKTILGFALLIPIMREILFRGQTRRKGEKVYVGTGKPVDSNWVYGGIFQGTGDFSIIYSYEPIEKHTVYTDTVGQFTGLTDKNGKKIFEGDIVKFTAIPFGYSNIGVVCFNAGSFCIKYLWHSLEKVHRIGQVDEWQDMGASGEITYNYEVIGNIHDNPELLEV